MLTRTRHEHEGIKVTDGTSIKALNNGLVQLVRMVGGQKDLYDITYGSILYKYTNA